VPMLNFIDIGTHLYCVSILDCRFNRHYVITAEELLGSDTAICDAVRVRVETEEGWRGVVRNDTTASSYWTVDRRSSALSLVISACIALRSLD
jgi:hypothetical protein